ncbi:MAG: hypothetical protein J3K34DRAFT_526002 [Monoraphidium minutum]|nr:MAG: hypothetical protein J3K34DRAFT_526002 [Monoraphidium minutum]
MHAAADGLERGVSRPTMDLCEFEPMLVDGPFGLAAEHEYGSPLAGGLHAGHHPAGHHAAALQQLELQLGRQQAGQQHHHMLLMQQQQRQQYGYAGHLGPPHQQQRYHPHPHHQTQQLQAHQWAPVRAGAPPCHPAAHDGDSSQRSTGSVGCVRRDAAGSPETGSAPERHPHGGAAAALAARAAALEHAMLRQEAALHAAAVADARAAELQQGGGGGDAAMRAHIGAQMAMREALLARTERLAAEVQRREAASAAAAAAAPHAPAPGDRSLALAAARQLQALLSGLPPDQRRAAAAELMRRREQLLAAGAGAAAVAAAALGHCQALLAAGPLPGVGDGGSSAGAGGLAAAGCAAGRDTAATATEVGRVVRDLVDTTAAALEGCCGGLADGGNAADQCSPNVPGAAAAAGAPAAAGARAAGSLATSCGSPPLGSPPLGSPPRGGGAAGGCGTGAGVGAPSLEEDAVAALLMGEDLGLGLGGGGLLDDFLADFADDCGPPSPGAPPPAPPPSRFDGGGPPGGSSVSCASEYGAPHAAGLGHPLPSPQLSRAPAARYEPAARAPSFGAWGAPPLEDPRRQVELAAAQHHQRARQLAQLAALQAEHQQQAAALLLRHASGSLGDGTGGGAPLAPGRPSLGGSGGSGGCDPWEVAAGGHLAASGMHPAHLAAAAAHHYAGHSPSHAGAPPLQHRMHAGAQWAAPCAQHVTRSSAPGQSGPHAAAQQQQQGAPQQATPFALAENQPSDFTAGGLQHAMSAPHELSLPDAAPLAPGAAAPTPAAGQAAGAASGGAPPRRVTIRFSGSLGAPLQGDGAAAASQGQQAASGLARSASGGLTLRKRGSGLVGPGAAAEAQARLRPSKSQRLLSDDGADSHAALLAPPAPPPRGHAGSPLGGAGSAPLAAAAPGGRRVSLADLVSAGYLPPGDYEFGVGAAQSVSAAVTPRGSIVFCGEEHGSVSSFALAAARGRNPARQACDGWKEVRLGGRRLEAFRDAYVRGLPPPNVLAGVAHCGGGAPPPGGL